MCRHGQPLRLCRQRQRSAAERRAVPRGPWQLPVAGDRTEHLHADVGACAAIHAARLGRTDADGRRALSSPAAPSMQPLRDWPVAARAGLVGVLTDIDDTLTTEGAITG